MLAGVVTKFAFVPVLLSMLLLGVVTHFIGIKCCESTVFDEALAQNFAVTEHMLFKLSFVFVCSATLFCAAFEGSVITMASHVFL